MGLTNKIRTFIGRLWGNKPDAPESRTHEVYAELPTLEELQAHVTEQLNEMMIQLAVYRASPEGYFQLASTKGRYRLEYDLELAYNPLFEDEAQQLWHQAIVTRNPDARTNISDASIKNGVFRITYERKNYK